MSAILRPDVDKARAEWDEANDKSLRAFRDRAAAFVACVAIGIGCVCAFRLFYSHWLTFAPLAAAVFVHGWLASRHDRLDLAYKLARERWVTLDRAHSKVFFEWLDKHDAEGDEGSGE